MFGENSTLIFMAVTLPGIIGLIVLSWPWSKVRTTTIRRRIDAPRDRVWKVYFVDLDYPDSAALYSFLSSARRLDDDPSVWELVNKGQDGDGAGQMTMRYRLLTVRPPEHLTFRLEQVDDRELSGEEASLVTLTFAEVAGGTEVVFVGRGSTANLWQHLTIWWGQRRFIRRLAQISKSGAAAGSATEINALWKSLALTALAVGSFSVLVHWGAALLLSAVLIMHEFGHWLALRLTGHPAPRIMLIPFFGGIAIGNRPHKSLFDNAFVALMGAGFSALPCIGLLVAGFLLGAPEIEKVLEVGKNPDYLPKVMILLAMGIGALNALQLLPVLPLDGGQILRALVQSFGARHARLVLLLIAAVGIVGFGYWGDFIIVGLLVLGALQAWELRDPTPDARPMSIGGATVIGLGYAAVMAVHVFAVVYAFWLLRIDPMMFRIDVF